MLKDKVPYSICLLFVLCSLPAVLMRDLNTVNELNYLAIAKDALAQGHFFIFGGEKFGSALMPPLYMWLCMIAYAVAGIHASAVMLAMNVLFICFMMYLCSKFFSSDLSKQYAIASASSLCALPFVCIPAFAMSPYVLNAALIVAACALLSRRLELCLLDPDNLALRRRSDIFIPACMFASLLNCGPFGLVIPPLTLAVVLFIKMRFKLFLRIFPLHWWLYMLTAALIWFSLTFFEGGQTATYELFIQNPADFLTGKLGHEQPPFFYLYIFLLISLPLGTAALYSGIRILSHERTGASVNFLFALFMPLVTLMVCSVTAAKSEFYVLCALPTLPSLLCRYLQEAGSRDSLVKLLLFAGFMPFSVLFISLYWLNDDFPLLNGTYVVCAFLFILLSTALSVIRTVSSSALNGIQTFSAGVLIMILTLGFAVPGINPYFSPEQAVKKAALLSKSSGVNELCVIGIPKPWTLSLISEDLKIRDVSYEELVSKKCSRSYRLIGRSAQKKWSDLRVLKNTEGAFIAGDLVLLEPQQVGRKTSVWDSFKK